MRDEGSEDAVVSDSNYRLRSRGEIDSFTSWLYKGESSSLHIVSPPWERTSGYPSWRKSRGGSDFWKSVLQGTW